MTASHLQPCDTAGAVRRHAALDALSDASNWLLETMNGWRQRRRGRSQLARLDERMLADIGLSRSDAEFLANKPFWREQMDAILMRTADLPAPKPPDRAASGAKRLLRMLSAMAYRAAERLTSPQRDVSPEFYRFPPF